MNNARKRLAEEKKRLDLIHAPEELEARLRNKLNTTPNRRKRMPSMWKLAAVALVMIVIISYQYNAFAYYGKKLLGFDEVISGTIRELNNEGMGQIVDERTTFENGTELTIDGIMTDANQLIMYYTLTNPNGVGDYDTEMFRPFNITGFLTNSHLESGTSLLNDDQTELKGVLTFEPVSPFSKELTLHFWQGLEGGQMLELEQRISFTYDPNKAIKTEIKQAIKQTFTADQGKITFNWITASPMLTVIEGKLNVDNFDRTQLGLDGIELIANGKRVDIIGSGSRSGLLGRNFDIRYDALPKQLESLELVIKAFVGYQTLNENLPLTSLGDKAFMLDDKELWIKAVSETSDGIEITIASGYDVLLDGVSIGSKDGMTPLSTTIGQIDAKQENGEIMKERTLVFDTSEKPEYLHIQGMHVTKQYNEVIEIPID
ncbi:hypothetical protein CWR48_02210 [Oceanobacillus arenosus]|uniref:DUF4179 domain-containing protein n=2 Tax=Oceanobacillus arenosus TaxID=1229153 RepID=A0A3D8Q1G6_9BACI|nr:hypothetical protein CWR48_02210 [Oceanobacillus arenosus]